jgi:hypothetical protein
VNVKDESIRELQEQLDEARKRIEELTQRTDLPLVKLRSSQTEWETDWSVPIATPDEIAAKIFHSDPVKAKTIALALRRLIDHYAKV